MLSLKNNYDILQGARELMRARRMARLWRQDELAQKSGVGVATLRRFENTGRISFASFAKLLATLGLADKFLDALKQPNPAPKNIEEFLADAPKPARRRAPRRRKETTQQG